MKRTRSERIRLGLLYLAVCLFFVIATARLVHLQVIKSSQYSEIVKHQSSGKVGIPAGRGIIYDRNGRIVADNISRSSLYVYALNKKELKQVSRYLEKLFNLKPGTAQSRYGLKVRKFRWIKRHISDELAARIDNDTTVPKGLHLRQETKRTYPWGTIGKQILGFTDIDNNGQSGIELTCNKILAGKKGWADIRRDGLRNLYRVKETALVKPVPGQSVILTIDWRFQEVLEEELRRGVDTFNAKAGMGVFIDCNTGEVLAMAHYDPTEQHPLKPVKLRPVTDQFEPGSIFKAITTAGMLDAGIIDFSDSTYCENGKWKIGNRTLHDDKKHEWLSFRQIIELSSNIGVAKHAIEFGGDALYETARRFGFGEKPGIGLGGETRGRVYCPEKWSDYTISALSIGHSVAVSGLQMAMAFAAIANGGELLKPRLVLCNVNPDGQVTKRFGREVVRRVVKKSSADSLRAFLRGVVERGTAEKANSSAIAIAGKTGTAELPKPNGRGYYKHKFVASFAGFFPYDNPSVAGIIVFWEPEPIHYGGHTAAPVFRRIAERYLVLNPDYFAVTHQTLQETEPETERTIETPDLVGRDYHIALAMAQEHDITVRANMDDGIVVWQYPEADRLVFRGEQVLVVLKSADSSSLLMPNLRGLSIRQASAFLAFAGITSRVAGHGKVVKQSIKPGEQLTGKKICWLECRPT